MTNKDKLRITKEKAHKIAVANVMFFSFASIGCWMAPLFSHTWHVKRWYVGLGAVAAIKLEFGLMGYKLDMQCEDYSWDWQKNLCLSGGGRNVGEHSYFELQDWLCHVQQSSYALLFQGCGAVQMLNWGALIVMCMICLTLWFLLIGMTLSYLYYFAGLASPRMWKFMVAMFTLAPSLQLCALAGYVAFTYDMDSFVDIGVLKNMPGGKLIVGSPTGTITFNHGFIGAVCCMFLSCSPGMALSLAGRDKDLEQETEDWNANPNGYGATGEGEGYWGPDETGNVMPAGYAGQQDPYSQQSGYPQDYTQMAQQQQADPGAVAGYGNQAHYSQPGY